MKIAIISCFETYQNRIDDMKKYYLSRNNEVVIIKSNYLHFKKQYIGKKDEDTVLIDVPSYKKNISIKRIISHFMFSKRTLKYLNNNDFDLIHVLIPPNSLCKQLSKLDGNVKIIYDVIDFWPETMPLKRVSSTSFYRKWKKLRNNYIGDSDFIITECNLFENRIREELLCRQVETVYFTREEISDVENLCLSDKKIELVYLGSINNIIDIENIVLILKELNKKIDIIFHLIGGGENKTRFLKLLDVNMINYVDYGLVYDFEKKREIFSKCAFAFNIMKPDVFVGLTMKSLDYFQYGIPIINNISYDTEKIVDDYLVGVNVNSFNSNDELIETIISKSRVVDNTKMRRNVSKMFTETFSFNILEKKMDAILDEIMLNKSDRGSK
ncbi:hypothetical protein JZO80_04990 [Vagococcus fluvialis]|uniref:hypothetical protein n=1 Tax=Vagococcus fluvialis TaxID=2738 RepID=UPI001A907E96|nr:hypothetical protein [Vagococcus fluvialis]MBO0419511.1 hypothetical protein [Vagococcus fluvialis]